MNAPLTSPSQQQAHASLSWTQQQSSQRAMMPQQPAAPRDVSKVPSTDAFLKDFTLVAEAAKRAQMAVMIRDLENIGL